MKLPPLPPFKSPKVPRDEPGLEAEPITGSHRIAATLHDVKVARRNTAVLVEELDHKLQAGLKLNGLGTVVGIISFSVATFFGAFLALEARAQTVNEKQDKRIDKVEEAQAQTNLHIVRIETMMEDQLKSNKLPIPPPVPPPPVPRDAGL